MKIADEKLRRLIISVIVLLPLFFQPLLGKSRAFAMSTKEEGELGQEFLTQIRATLNFVDDDFAQQYINDLGHYLIESVETKPFPFNFYVINDDELNAFAGPGGHIFFYSGLINMMDDVDELAGVMSHEIGHVSARHIARRVEQSKGLGLASMAGMLAGILVGGDAGSAIIMGSSAAAIQAQLHYSREDERQADQLGFRYASEAGFNPKGLIDSLNKIQKSQWAGTNEIPPYLLTHPTGPERMSSLDIMMRDYTPKPKVKEAARFERLFPLFQTILRAKTIEPREAQRMFNKELEEDPDSALAHFGLGMVYNARSEHDLAIEHFQKALKGLPESVPVLRALGEAYQLKGEDTKAIMVLEKSLEIDGKDRSALFLLAMSHQNLGEYQKAIRIYERLASINPVKEEVFYNLGVSYGREGNLAYAHYNFGIYFKRRGMREKARFHFQKAADLCENDPVLKDRIDKAMKEEPSRPDKSPNRSER